MSKDMARAFQKCVTYGRFRTDLKPLFDSRSLIAPMLYDHCSAVLIMSKTGDNPMRWEIFYLGNGDRNVDPDVSTRHQHPFLVSPDDPRVGETYQHTNPTQRDYVKPEAVFLVFISDTGENPPRIQIGRWERQVFEIDFQTVGIWKI